MMQMNELSVTTFFNIFFLHINHNYSLGVIILYYKLMKMLFDVLFYGDLGEGEKKTQIKK